MSVKDDLQDGTLPLPSGWRWVKLGEVGEFRHGGTPSKGVSHYWDGKIPWVSPKDMRTTRISDSEDHISQKALDESAACLVPKGTLLIVIRSGILARSLPIALVEREVSFNQDIKACLCRSDIISPEFLQLALRWLENSILADGVKKGATVHSIKSGYIESLHIPLPPFPEQKRIAAFHNKEMEAVEKARGAVKAQLDAANALPPSFLRQAFSKSGQQLPTGWRSVRFGEVVKITAKQVDPRIPEYAQLPHVSSADIESGSGRLLSLKTAHEDGMRSGKYLFNTGNILYSKIRPYLRKVAIATLTGVCSADIYPLDVNKKDTDAGYLLWLLLSEPFTKYASSESSRARMPKLNREQLASFTTHLPPLPEQRRIAAKLTKQMAAAQELRKSIEAQLEEINALPAALLRKAFNGEL